MVKTRDRVIVLLFMVAVTLINTSIKRGENVASVVGSIWKDVAVKISDTLKKTEIPELSEADLEAMQQQAGKYITEAGHSMDVASLVGYEYIGKYILQGKRGNSVEEPYQIYLISRVWIAVENNLNNIIPYYYLVRFSADLSEEGEWEIDYKRSMPENGTYWLENMLLTYVAGYRSIEELYDSVIKEKLKQYKCTENIDEDKTVQKNFEEINFADIRWAEEFEGASMGTMGEPAQTYEDSRLAKWAQISSKGVTEDGIYEYDAQGDTVTITKYVGQETEVVIPEEIAYRTKIILGDKAFQETNVTSVMLSDSVVEIADGYVGDAVFGGLTTLERVYISGSVKAVSAYTFGSCANLKEVILEEGITTIEAFAFYKCSSLESIEIPPTVNRIDKSAFEGSSITSISIKNGCVAEGLIRDHWTGEQITVEYYD